MSYKKEIIVLSGARGKGVVKLGGSDSAQIIKGSCSVDFKPTDATLYILSDKITPIKLRDSAAEFNCPASSDKGASCVLIANEDTLFGSNVKNADRIAEISRAKAYAAQAEKSLWENQAPPKHDVEPTHKSPEKKSENFKNKQASTPLPSDGIEKACGEQTDNKEPAETSASSKQTNTYTDDRRGSRETSAEELSDAEVVSLFKDGVQYDGTNFYFAVKPQIDEMFVCYPAEETLNAIVPNSKWVRVDADDDYYVVGLLYDLEAPSFICYGVPAVQKAAPPRELADMCVWLPADLAQKDGKGYWVIYQSAVNGQIVK